MRDFQGVGDQALVVGILCPYCQATHLLYALGMPQSDTDLGPTITLVRIDSEEDMVYARCHSCLETFRLMCIVQMFGNPGNRVFH